MENYLDKGQLKIFYTDDDEDDKEIFKEIVSEIKPHAEVELQSDGAELLHILRKDEVKPDLLFLDINMPNKDGFEVLDEMRERHHHKRIPVIMLSTSSNEDVINKARRMGATLYVCKPNSYGKFRSILTTLLEIDWKQGLEKDVAEKFVFC